MTGPRRLSAILERWQPANGGVEADATSVVATAWGEAVGSDVARRTRPGKLRDGVLTVFTAGSTWSHQLTFLAPTIIAELNERCPSSPVQRLRFVVASGRTKALLDGLARQPVERIGSGGRAFARPVHAQASLDTAAENVEDIVARLRRRQQSLDKRRVNEGFTRCAQCGSWSSARARPSGACEICAEEARCAADHRIERVLINAPWLRRSDIVSHLAVDDAAYDRVRRRLLSRWEEQMFATRRRLRRKELHAADRVLAWSYLMLRSGMQQHVIGRAVVADALGDDWADALVGAAVRHREAQTTASEKQRNTAARVFTRRNNT